MDFIFTTKINPNASCVCVCVYWRCSVLNKKFLLDIFSCGHVEY